MDRLPKRKVHQTSNVIGPEPPVELGCASRCASPRQDVHADRSIL